MALDGAKFICLSKAAATGTAETTPAAVKGDVAGDSAEAAAAESNVIKAKGRKFTVGYYMKCDYVLDDPRAIGVHCEIQCDAFGRVTIHNMSEEHPVTVNGQVITIKRPLLDGSHIQILDRTFLWKFPKSVDTTATSNTKEVEKDANDEDKISTPQKLVEAPEQAPNSCPDLKPHRKVDKRFTVHNFAYCINSDDEGNTTSELPSITESEYVEESPTDSDLKISKTSEEITGQRTEIGSSASGMLPQKNASQDSAEEEVSVEILKTERRSVTPEPQPSAPTVASTPIIKLESTPKLNLINCTQNKENKSTEKNRRIITLCKQSDLVITSFSPRETGVRNEKSFTAVLKPALTGAGTTPKSVYSTPKSVISDYNDERSRDFIDFNTPATSKKILGGRAVAKNSSMHLIDLTTPNKLTPSRSRPLSTLKCNKTLPSNVKLSTTPLAFTKVNAGSEEEEGIAVLPVTPLLDVSSSKSDTTPQSADSVISIDGSTGLYMAVIEVSTDDSATPSTSSPAVRVSSNTPQQAGSQKPLTSTPLRSTQSLKKRAILNSAKKNVNTPLRMPISGATPARQVTSTPARNINLEEKAAAGSSPHLTPKSRTVIGSPGSVAAVQRRGGVSATRGSTSKRAITTSTPVHTHATQSKQVNVSGDKSSSTLHRVRKSFGGTALSSHVSKMRRSIVSPRKHSPTYIGAKIVAKARNFTNATTSRMGSRSHSLVAAAISSTTEKKENTVALLNITEKAGSEDEVPSDNNTKEVNELSRTFILDALEEINVKVEDPSEPISKAQNVTFSPIKHDSTQIDVSASHKRELNITFSPEKSDSAGDCESRLEEPVDATETNVVAKENCEEEVKEKYNSTTMEHISESFGEVVEAKEKPEDVNKTQETSIAIEESLTTFVNAVIPAKKADTARHTPQGSEIKYASENADNEKSKRVEKYQVIETLDADEISNSEFVAQSDNNTAETTEPIDAEASSKPAGESQGTADFLEEIDYVLNKSDELQQQLCKDEHTTRSVNKDTVELEAENLDGNTEELLATENTNASVNTGGEENFKVEEENKSSKLENESEDSTTLAPNDATALGRSNSEAAAISGNSDMEDDLTSIDNVLSPLASEITSTDLDAGSLESEILSITSLTTPSEFDVSIIGSTSVGKSIASSDELKATAKPPVTNEADNTNRTNEPIAEEIEVDFKTNPSSDVTSTDLQAPETTAVKVSVNEPESTTDDVEDTLLLAEKIEVDFKTNPSSDVTSTDLQAAETSSVEVSVHEPESTTDDVEDTLLLAEDQGKEADVSTSAAIPIKSDKTKAVESETAKVSAEIESLSVYEVKAETFLIDEKLQLKLPECQAKSSAVDDPISNELEKDILNADTKSMLPEVIENAKSPALEPEVSLAEYAEPTTSIPATAIDFKELLEVTIQPKDTETLTNNTNGTTVASDESRKTVDTLSGDEEKENKIITNEESNASTDTKATALEPKTPNLCGLRNPKRSEAITPCFIGLRHLVRTPKASTSAAAAARAAEEDDDELIGVQALLKTPLHRQRDVQTPQPEPATESKTFTPRRSARRRASANAELTPTRCVTPTLQVVSETGTPRRTSRRRASATAEVSYTPQRITRRRSSLSLDNEEEIAAVLTPQKRGGTRSKRTALLADFPVAEDMGAIIEEEPKEAVQESTDAQQCTGDTVINSDVVESKGSVPSSAEVIEDSICDEVSTQKQLADEFKQKIVEEKVNERSEERTKLISEIGSVQLTEEPDKNGKNVETAPESPSDASAIQITKGENDVACDNLKATTTTDVTEERLQETEDLATVKTEETAEILDESDYEYGKEVKECEGRDVQQKTPKTHPKSVRIIDASNDSPKTPVMVGMRELLKTPKTCADTPKLIGVRDLLRTPKATIASAAVDLVDDEERFTGLADLVKTPKVAAVAKQKHGEDVVVGEEEVSSILIADNAAYIGMRELLKTPQHTSTPQYRGMRELLRTPKACSSPQLGGLEELMKTPKRTKLNTQFDDAVDDVELDQFFKTPRAKDVMIPAEPASAVLVPSSQSKLDIMNATTEYELHSSSQRGIEDIFKTPVSTRLTFVDTTATDAEENAKIEGEDNDETVAACTTPQSDIELIVPETPALTSASNVTIKRNLSAEEAFEELLGERTSLDETPPQKVYARKHRQVAAKTSVLSPFSATEVISDLPKTDIQEWVDSLEEGAAESELEEREVTVLASLSEASKGTRDPIATSVCETSGISVSKDTTEELLADISAVSSTVDPLLPSAAKSGKFVRTAVVDEVGILRPTTPSELEISGINSLDQTNDSVFSEPLVVSDSESVPDKQEIDEEKEKVKADANKSMVEEEFPTMFVDSSDSESEKGMNANKTCTPGSSDKQAQSTTLPDMSAGKNIIKKAPDTDTEVIDLDDSSESIESTPLSKSSAEKTSKTTDIRIEFSNFQAHKNFAGRQMRASTPNRYSKALKPEYKHGRRQSMGAEKQLDSTSIDLTHEKSRLAKEKPSTAANDEDCIIEVDEESIDESAVVEQVTTAAEEVAETTIDVRDEETPTSAITEAFHPEFSNFQAHKTIAARGKRAATPDQVSKTRAQKIIQARRLTLGAEQHLSDVSIDFVKEKTILEQSKQLPAHIDECILEIDDSDNESDTISAAEVTAKATDNDFNASEGAVQVENLTAESKEETLKSAQVAQAEQVIVKAAELFTDEHAVENTEAEISSTADVENVDNTKIIEYETECSTTEIDREAQKEPTESKTLNDIATDEPSTKDDLLPENERVAGIPPTAGEAHHAEQSSDASEATTLKEIAVEGPTTEGVMLFEIERATDIQPTVTETQRIEQNSDAPEGTTLEEIAAEEQTINEEPFTKDDLIPENERVAGIPPTAGVAHHAEQSSDAPEATTLKEIAVEIPTTEGVMLFDIERAADIQPTVTETQRIEQNSDAPEGTTLEEAAAEVPTIDEIVLENENKSEIPPTVEASIDSSEAPESSDTIPSVATAGPEKTSTTGNEFDESDLFDLTDESPKESPVYNTTQGVIFDLTEEEDIEDSIEKETNEHIPENVDLFTARTEEMRAEGSAEIKPDEAVEVPEMQVEDDEIVAGEIETVAATALKSSEVHLDTSADEGSTVVVVSSNEINLQITSASENCVATRTIEPDIDNVVELSSTDIEEKASADNGVIKEALTDEGTETKMTEKQVVAEVELQEEKCANNEVVTDQNLPAMEAEIAESDAETPKAEIQTSEVYISSVEVPKLSSDTANEVKETNAVAESSAQVLSDNDEDTASACASVNMLKEKGESLSVQAEPVVRMEDSVIELDSDVEEIAEEPLADTKNEQATAMEPDMVALTKTVDEEREGGIESEHVEEKLPEMATTPTYAPKALEIEHSKQPVTSEKLVAEQTQDAIKDNAEMSEANVQKSRKPEEITEDMGEKAAAIEVVAAVTANENDTSNEATSYDREHQPARRVYRKASRSKQVTAENDEAIFKDALESEILVEETATISEQSPSDIANKHFANQQVEDSVVVVPEEPNKSAADAITQEETTDKTAQKTVAEEWLKKLEESVSATSSDSKQQPAQRKVRKPSRSKKTATVEKGESNVKALSESEILIENAEQKSQKVSTEALAPETELESPLLIDSDAKAGEKVSDASKEDATGIPDLQVPLVEENADVESVEKEPSVKRRVRKPSRSKQTLEGNGEDISETTIGSKTFAEEPLSVEEKPDLVESKEDMSVNIAQSAESAQKQVELVDEVMLPTTSTENITKVSVQNLPEAVESSEEIVKLHEERSSDESPLPANEKDVLITKAFIKSQSMIEESALIECEATTSKAKIGSKTPVDESAPVEEPTPEIKEELPIHIKASYEVCLSTTTDTLHGAEADKAMELALPDANEKLKTENEATSVTTKGSEPTDIAEKQEDAPAQRSTRRYRKGSHSSQCSNQDEELLPTTTTTTRRRGGRRRAETPVGHSADEAASSDVPAVKRRRGPGKAAEDLHLEDIQEVQVDERENKTEGQVIKGAETEDNKEVETKNEHIKSPTNEASDDNGVEEKQLEEDISPVNTTRRGHENIEDGSSNTSSTDSVSVKVIEETLAMQKTVTSDTTTKRGASRRRRGEKFAEEVNISVEKASVSKIAENINEEHSDAVELVNDAAVASIKVAEVVPKKQQDVAVPKRGRRKQTVSESSQTSSTAEHLELHTIQRRRRGRRPTAEEPIADALIETAKTSETNTLLAEEARSTEVGESLVPSIADEHDKKGVEAIIKTEKENDEENHHAVAETSKRALTRNKKQLKSSETPKDNVELSEGTEELKEEPQRETSLMEQEEAAKTTVTTGRTRINRRKKVEADGGEHQYKPENDDAHHKVDETAGPQCEAKTATVEQPPNEANESLGGRRGRRGAAAAATVAINEVSSAHKRATPRARGHQIKTQQEDTKMEFDEGATGHVKEPSALEEKKAHRVVRKRRGSIAENQLVHTDAHAGKTETEEAESSPKTAVKRARKRLDSHHAAEFQSTYTQECHDEATTATAPSDSPSAASTKQRGRRKRNDSLHSADGAAASVGGDEPSKKRPPSRKRRDSSLDSSIHDVGGADVDANAGGNTSSSSTTPQRSRNVPRRAAAAQDRNYDESSDAEAQVDLKRRIEKASLPKTGTSSTAIAAATSSKHLSPTAAGADTAETVAATVAEISANIVSTPILSATTTSRGGRQRKPTARVQQYLEEERAKAETPKKRLLLSSAAGGETPAQQTRATPARRTRKASAIETEATETPLTQARGRARNAKALKVADTSEESRSEVEHSHSEIETTHSSSHAEEKESATTAKVIKRPTRRGKQTGANLRTEGELNEAQQAPAAPTQEAHAGSSRGGRAAKAAAASALLPDEPTGSHTKARVGRALRGAKVKITEEEQHLVVETEETRAAVATPTIADERTTKKVRTAAAGGRALRGGRRNKQQLDEEDTHSHSSQHGLPEDSEASSSSGLQQLPPQQSLAVDADDEHEEDEETLMVTGEEEEDKPLATVKKEKAADKKRTVASTRRVAAAASAADSPAPKRGRRRAAAAGADRSDVAHSDIHSESVGSSRSRKVVRFDAATPSSTARAAKLAETVAEELPAATSAPATRATRSRRK